MNDNRKERSVIFLDVDGVLNTRYAKERCPGGAIIGVQQDLIKNLRHIIDETGAEVVLSSSWRICFKKKKNGNIRANKDGRYLLSELEKQGVSLSGMTPKTKKGAWYRGYEILTYLKYYPADHIVILDDEDFDFDKQEIEGYHVKTDFYEEGLSKEKADDAIHILKTFSAENLKPVKEDGEEPPEIIHFGRDL